MIDLERLKARLNDLSGLSALSVTNIGGRMVFGFNGLLAAIDPRSTIDDAERAIRKVYANPPAPPPAPIQIQTPMIASAATAATTIQPQGKSMSITGAAPATLSIKQMIEASRQTVQAAHQKLTTNAAKVQQAAAALDSLGDDLGKEGDDLLAMVGQYKNDLAGS